MRPGIRGIIFDMDGVLVHTEPIHARAWEKAFGDSGVPFPREQLLDWVGIPDEQLTAHAAARYPQAQSPGGLLALKRGHYRRLVAAEVRPCPELAASLARLRAAGIAMAIATSSRASEAEHTLACAGLLEWFPLRIAAEDVSLHKPAPDPFLAAARLLQLPAAACAAIEDSPAGIQAAAAAGCLVLAVSSSHGPERLRQAEWVCASTVEAIGRLLAEEAGAGARSH